MGWARYRLSCLACAKYPGKEVPISQATGFSDNIEAFTDINKTVAGVSSETESLVETYALHGYKGTVTPLS
jgi:hypothetical protein